MTRTPTLAQLLDLVGDKRAEDDLRAYFDNDPPARGLLYTGRRFEFLAGGGDRSEVQNRFTAEDLVAVELLRVKVPGEVAIDLLDGELGAQVAAQLASIDTRIPIGDPDAAELLADGGPADAAWKLLEEPDGMGWVTANKLLARKRPQLVPVYDRVVSCAYQPPNRKLWNWLNPLFAEQDGALPAALDKLRAAAGVPAKVTPLRVLDVVVWMRHRREHRPTRCRGVAWSPLI